MKTLNIALSIIPTPDGFVPPKHFDGFRVEIKKTGGGTTLTEVSKDLLYSFDVEDGAELTIVARSFGDGRQLVETTPKKIVVPTGSPGVDETYQHLGDFAVSWS